MILNRFIAYLDILGFSKKVEKTELNELVEEYKILIKNALEQCSPEIFNGKNTFKAWNIDWAIASDTILLITIDETERDFENLIEFSLSFLFHCFSSHYPVRGAVDYGEFYYNKNDGIYIGKSLVNAHKIAEKQDWAGIILTKNCIDKIGKETEFKNVMKKLLDKKKIIDYKVPLKDKLYIKHPILHWAPRYGGKKGLGDPEPLSEEEFREIFLPHWLYNKKPVKYNIEKKIQNTYRYYIAHYKDKIF